MAKDEIKRVGAPTLSKDRDALNALKRMPGYQTLNPAFTLEKNLERAAIMLAAQEREIQLVKDLKAGRDDASEAEWSFHNGILGTKDQVVAQYSLNSNEVQSMGLKKKKEYKRPSRKKVA